MSSDNSGAPRAGSSRRSELKRAYKEKPPPAGVFAIRNLANGKVLVGSSLNLPGAFNGARFQLTQGVYRASPELQADWKHYGAEQFSFEVLDTLPEGEDAPADPREELQVLEGLWLERLRPYGDAGYNAPPRG